MKIIVQIYGSSNLVSTSNPKESHTALQVIFALCTLQNKNYTRYPLIKIENKEESRVVAYYATIE